jgi:TRP (transient receptor potential)-like protein
MLTSFRPCQVAILLLFSSLPARVLGGDVLQTNGFTSCDGSNAAITVQNVNITYNKATQLVDFNVAGTSNEVQNVTATMTVTAYGQQIYQKSFDPCDPSTTVAQLCPGELL